MTSGLSMKFQDLLAYQQSFALACKYIDKDIFEGPMELNRQVGKLVYFMRNRPDKFGSK